MNGILFIKEAPKTPNMISENEITEGCNVSFNGVLFSVKWKQATSVIIRPIDDIGFIQTNYEALEPITIDEEVLEKIGFNKKFENVFAYTDKEERVYEIELLNDSISLRVDGQEINDALYLHKLQKLVFDLCKECLSLKDIGNA